MKVDGNARSSIGYCAHKDTELQVFESDTGTTVVDGSIFPAPRGARFIHRYLTRGRPVRSVARTLLEEPGAFAVAFSRSKELHAFRDLNGMKPLYYAEDNRLIGFGSERKALWKIGLNKAQRVAPGHLYSVKRGRLTHSRLAHFPHPRERRMNMRQASSRLSRLLERSMRRLTEGIDKLAIAFSGGLDSALTASLAKRTHPGLEAVSAGLPGSPELSTVEKWAQQLNLPITVETFEPETLEAYLRRVIWLIEEPNLMKVSVAVPLHWAAMVAAQRGFRVMLCGQGSDELYGGYYKYARILDNKGRRKLTTELYRSVVNSAQVNYERDDQATAPFGIELRTPFADLDVIKFSMTIPSELKVKAGNDLMRKWVLRNVAKEAGLPDEIVWRRKKAIQHGTGVENAIRKLAKRQGLTAEGYLSKLQEEVISMESMPDVPAGG